MEIEKYTGQEEIKLLYLDESYEKDKYFIVGGFLIDLKKVPFLTQEMANKTKNIERKKQKRDIDFYNTLPGCLKQYDLNVVICLYEKQDGKTIDFANNRRTGGPVFDDKYKDCFFNCIQQANFICSAKNCYFMIIMDELEKSKRESIANALSDNKNVTQYAKNNYCIDRLLKQCVFSGKSCENLLIDLADTILQQVVRYLKDKTNILAEIQDLFKYKNGSSTYNSFIVRKFL